MSANKDELARLTDAANQMLEDGKQEAEIAWSVDEENFKYFSLGDLLDANDDVEVGHTVYFGKAVTPPSSQLCDADDVIEMMRDRAGDIAGEYAEDYPDVSKEEKEELDALLSAWIGKCCPPTFYRVENVKEYTITDDDLAPYMQEQSAN